MPAYLIPYRYKSRHMAEPISGIHDNSLTTREAVALEIAYDSVIGAERVYECAPPSALNPTGYCLDVTTEVADLVQEAMHRLSIPLSDGVRDWLHTHHRYGTQSTHGLEEPQ